jgi:hypothetical protein
MQLAAGSFPFHINYSSSSINGNIANTWQERKEIVCHHWPSIAIRVDAVIWGDQNRDGKTKGILKIKRNIPYWI